MPRIDAAGKFEDAVLIRNASGAAVRDLEITNTGTGRLFAGECTSSQTTRGWYET
jgi:hypothetical protein